MSAPTYLNFDTPDLATRLATLDDRELDAVDFGIIGFDADTIVRRYNTTESTLAGLPRENVLGQPLFTVVAPCMNNFMVAQRFEDAVGTGLDATIDYVLTLRMKPVKVKLRLLASPALPLRHVLVNRRP